MMKQFTFISGFFSGRVSVEPVCHFFNQYLGSEIGIGQNRDSTLPYTPSPRWLTLILYFAIVTATDTEGQGQHLESLLLPSAISQMEKTGSTLISYNRLENNNIDLNNSFSR